MSYPALCAGIDRTLLRCVCLFLFFTTAQAHGEQLNIQSAKCQTTDECAREFAQQIAEQSLRSIDVAACEAVVKKELRGIDVPVPNACFDQYSELTPQSTYRIDFNDDRLIDVTQPKIEGYIEQPARRARVAHIVLKNFESGSSIFLARSLHVVYERGLKGVVIDVRKNSGGLLGEALDAVSLFVTRGVSEEILLTIEHKQGSDCYRAGHLSSGFDGLECMLISPHTLIGITRPPITFMEDLAVVVLVDKDTASAAELFAGILQLLEKPLVGETTYGKGVGQSIVPMEEEQMVLELTTFEYFLGESTKVNGIGITPDHDAVDDPSTEVDEALKRAVAVAVYLRLKN